MSFPESLGTISCRCVVERGKPVRFVSHAGGDWQMYCHAENHDFDDEAIDPDLVIVHVAHLVSLDPTLDALADLPVDMGPERDSVAAEWSYFPDADDD